MCMTRKSWLPPAVALAPVAVAGLEAVGSDAPTPKARTQRRRLWELSASAACPVLGSCVPMPQLEGLMAKARLDTHQRSHYDLHVIAVSECRQRSPLAESVQKALDQRFALDIAAAKALQGEDALEQHWQTAQQRADWAGPLWAMLTHPHCTLTLEHRILGEVHMLQHQVGMSSRLEKRVQDDVRAELQRTRAALQETQQRWQADQQEAARKLAQSQAETREARLQAARETAARERLQVEWDKHRVRGATPTDLLELEARNQYLTAQVRSLQEALKTLQRAHSPIARAESANGIEKIEKVTRTSAVSWLQTPQDCNRCPETTLQLCRVVCVGGRANHVPVLKAVVEARGGTLVHHDGGEQDSLQMLSSALTAADLVVCQVGCISHNAYWRVKAHCKRTGTPCAFVETPSRSALERALQALVAP